MPNNERFLREFAIVSTNDVPARASNKTAIHGSDRIRPRGSVDALAGDHAPDTASRVVQVASPSWYEVNVTMKDRLSGIFACVHAHIEPGNFGILLLNGGSFGPQQGVNGIAFGLVQIKVVGNVALRDHQGMMVGDRGIGPALFDQSRVSRESRLTNTSAIKP